jgi:hypothetical protein
MSSIEIKAVLATLLTFAFVGALAILAIYFLETFLIIILNVLIIMSIFIIIAFVWLVYKFIYSILDDRIK